MKGKKANCFYFTCFIYLWLPTNFESLRKKKDDLFLKFILKLHSFFTNVKERVKIYILRCKSESVDNIIKKGQTGFLTR